MTWQSSKPPGVYRLSECTRREGLDAQPATSDGLATAVGSESGGNDLETDGALDLDSKGEPRTCRIYADGTLEVVHGGRVAKPLSVLHRCMQVKSPRR